MRALAALIATLWLPAGGTFSSVQPAGSALLLTGFAETGPACIWSTVDPSRMRLLRTHRGPCDRVPGRLHPSVVYDPKSPWQEVVLSNGRVVFRYQDASDTRPQWTYGPGALWIYDVWTRTGAQAVRVSLANGRIVQRVHMPKMFRPVLAADLDGLWLAAASNGGLGPGGPQPLLHVSPGGRSATVVHRGGRAALWLVAHGHTVVMEQIAGRAVLSLWRVDGTRVQQLAKPSFLAVAAAWGDGSVWAVAANRQCTRNEVLRVDPASGSATHVASVTAASCDWLGSEANGIAFADGALFFLDPPWLRRIRP